eukprot:TRINITY_DN15121_c0_g1_i1.p1 TRINITY_DN15121_c0_g1~~TRINITY_DN15121_c0_g1_i1.p1  ORF type:complete len:216 (-),score=25.55 TRINITY_DN15121_c0_g1_i1:257-904(-)
MAPADYATHAVARVPGSVCYSADALYISRMALWQSCRPLFQLQLQVSQCRPAVPPTSIEARLALASAFFRQELEEASAFAAVISTAMPYTLEMANLTGEPKRLSSAHNAAHGAPHSRRQKELGELIMRLTLPEKSKAKQSAALHIQALVFLAWHMTLRGRSVIERVGLPPHVKLVASLIRATAAEESAPRVPKELSVIIESEPEEDKDADSEDGE